MPRMRQLIIINAGSFGREVLTWAGQAMRAGAPFKLKGFLDSRPDALRGFAYELPILASPESYQPDEDDVFLCAIGTPHIKQRYCALMEQKGANFATLIHPSAVIGHDVQIGEGSILGPFTQLSARTATRRTTPASAISRRSAVPAKSTVTPYWRKEYSSGAMRRFYPGHGSAHGRMWERRAWSFAAWRPA